MDFLTITLIVITLFIAIIGSFGVYTKHEMEETFKEINQQMETINNKIILLDKRIDDLYEKQKNINEELRMLINSKFKD